jgi:hypothetical protein
MRLTYSSALAQFLDNTGNTGSTDANLIAFFGRQLQGRYQMAFSEIKNKTTQTTFTGTTVVGQQYYHYPPGIIEMADCTVTINGLAYPVITDDSILQWDRINLVLISTTAIPQFIFPRKDDFGIWPVPQGLYPITIVVRLRDRTPSVGDYVTGTVTCTNNSQTVTGAGTTWTSAMNGRWFCMNDSTKPGYGYWYRISSVQSTTSLTLETVYVNTSVTGASYVIGETFELPEEVHPNIVDGVVSDYFSGPRSDVEKASWWENKYWTGNPLEKEREGKKFAGGILGCQQRYAGRIEGSIVWKHGMSSGFWERMWASTLSAGS